MPYTKSLNINSRTALFAPFPKIFNPNTLSIKNSTSLTASWKLIDAEWSLNATMISESINVDTISIIEIVSAANCSTEQFSIFNAS